MHYHRWFWSIAVIVFLFDFHALHAEDFPLVVSTDPLPPQEQQKRFHLPPGFEIQLVAAEPDVQKPINMNFDHAGRLYFSQSVEYPYAAKEGAKPRDTVRVIEGIGRDGRAAKVRVAVDGLNIPIGVLPLYDRLLVFSIPNIYSCRDEDGDGLYEKREVLFGPFGQRDTHGLNNGFTRGLDGWIYACHGFANDSRVRGRDGYEVVMNSGNTYRFRADGSRIEHYTHGQVNPFGLCFDPLGNLYSADCHTLPAYMLLRGAYYPSFGKPHDGLGFGPAMMQHSHGSTGIAGIVYYAAEQFPQEYRDTLFIGNPITHCVNHDKLVWHGSTPEAIEQPDFIRCDDPWFRPVDLKLGPDGALYIADFYNRIIGHYEVPLDHPGRDRERGRIWRVVYTGTKEKPIEPLTPPDLTKLDLDGLIEKLGDGNFVVRTMATHEINDRFGVESYPRIDELLKGDKLNPLRRSHVMYVHASQKKHMDILDRLWQEEESSVRVHAVRSLAGIAKAGSRFPLEGVANGFICARLEDKDATVRRAAAECFGDLSPSFALPITGVWKATEAGDTQLRHALRIALRGCFAHEGAYENGLTKRIANAAEHRTLVADVSLGIPHTASAAFLFDYLANNLQKNSQFDEMLGHAVRYLPPERLAEAYKLVEKLREEPAGRQRSALVEVHRALQARGTKTPDKIVTWATDVAAKLLASKRERDVAGGIEIARQMKLAAVRPRLEEIANGNGFESLRPAAIDACVACDAFGSIGMLAGLAGSAKAPMALRQKAAQALGSVNNEAAHRELAVLLAHAPAQLEADIASGLSGQPAAAELLLAAIESGKASPHVLKNAQVAARLRLIKIDALHERIARLTAALPADDERVRSLIAKRIAGFGQAKADVAAGKQAFTQVCAACHKIGGEGTKIGPDLDGIGNRGIERMAEDILDPSRNVDQAFRTTIVTTDDGRSINGLALREEGKVLVLADSQGKDVRVPTDNILERTVSPLSPMPANVAEQLSEAEFYQLLAFLLAQDAQREGMTR
jgi:putative heme-binding domain-containing protein